MTIMPWKDPEKRKQYRQRPEVKERARKYQEEYSQRPEVKERARKLAKKYRDSGKKKRYPEKEREYRQRPENLEKERIRDRKRYVNNSEERKKHYIIWAKKNHEYLKSYWNIRSKKFPRAKTERMTIYRRSHKQCEWYGCNESRVLHVHHILPKSKYPEFIDGNYNGREMNNFISYCPVHHFTYHLAYATKRNDEKHKKSLGLLWGNIKDFSVKNEIPMENFELEISYILKGF